MENLAFVKLNEMREQLAQSKNKILSIVNQQELLIKIINNSDFKEEFVDFVKSLDESNKKYSKQYKELDTKEILIEEILDKLEAENDKETCAEFDKLFNVLGIK